MIRSKIGNSLSLDSKNMNRKSLHQYTSKYKICGYEEIINHWAHKHSVRTDYSEEYEDELEIFFAEQDCPAIFLYSDIYEYFENNLKYIGKRQREYNLRIMSKQYTL